MDRYQTLCVYTSGWCDDVTVILQLCSPDLESFFINFNLSTPLVSLRSGWCLHSNAGGTAHARRPDTEYGVDKPGLLSIVLRDFNKGNLNHELPKYLTVH